MTKPLLVTIPFPMNQRFQESTYVLINNHGVPKTYHGAWIAVDGKLLALLILCTIDMVFLR